MKTTGAELISLPASYGLAQACLQYCFPSFYLFKSPSLYLLLSPQLFASFLSFTLTEYSSKQKPASNENSFANSTSQQLVILLRSVPCSSRFMAGLARCGRKAEDSIQYKTGRGKLQRHHGQSRPGS